jgi:hypothetical protein
MKRQMMHLWLLIGLVVSVCGCAIEKTEPDRTQGELTPASPPGGWLAVYFAPNAEDDSLHGEEPPEDILVVRTTEELQEAFDQEPPPTMLYFQSGALDDVDRAWLKEHYRAGVMIIAINAPISELGARLEVYSEMEDIDMVSPPPGFTVFSAQQFLSGGHWVLSDYFASFASAASALAVSDEYNRTAMD